MPNAGKLEPDSRFMALFVGPKHSGKTVAAASFIRENQPAPNKDRGRVFDFDGRIRGLLGAPWINRNLIDYDYYPPKTGVGQTVFEKLNNDLQALFVSYQVGQCPYNTIITDSLTAETFALLNDSIPLTHGQKTENGKTRETGKRIGTMNMPGPEDYGFEANGTYQLLAFLRSFPAKNIIVTAHVVDKYGKVDPANPFSESTVVGEKLSLRDKIGTNIGIYFDHIFRFDRKVVGNQERFYVKFISEIACTSFPGMPVGEVDITGRSFYDIMMEYVERGQKK